MFRNSMNQKMAKDPFPLATKPGSFSIEDILSKSPCDEATDHGFFNNQTSSLKMGFETTKGFAIVCTAKETGEIDTEGNVLQGNTKLVCRHYLFRCYWRVFCAVYGYYCDHIPLKKCTLLAFHCCDF